MSTFRLTMLDTDPGSECILTHGDQTFAGIIRYWREDGTVAISGRWPEFDDIQDDDHPAGIMYEVSIGGDV